MNVSQLEKKGSFVCFCKNSVKRSFQIGKVLSKEIENMKQFGSYLQEIKQNKILNV